MSAGKIALLGAIAGLTIFLGLPIGRLRRPAPRLRALLNAGAVGILLFLLWDVLAHAWQPVDEALSGHLYSSALGDGLVLGAGRRHTSNSVPTCPQAARTALGGGGIRTRVLRSRNRPSPSAAGGKLSGAALLPAAAPPRIQRRFPQRSVGVNSRVSPTE